MRVAFACAVLLAWPCLACGAGLAQSNGSKLGEALAFAAAAGAAQVVESVAEQQARNNASVNRASTGVNVAPACNNQGQYGCVSVAVAPAAGDAPEPEMDDDEARDYVLGYVNGVRKLNGVGPVVREESVDAFAQAGSVELARDHRPFQHMVEHARELHGVSAEVQGSPDGSRAGSLQDQIAEMLLRFMREGPGGMHHDVLLRPEWLTLGVGIVHSDGRMYFTVDFAG
jgi:hypothetical protein